MNNTSNLLSKKISITNELGLHARPAAKIAEVAQGANSKVWIIKDAQRVDASSIIDILTLACIKGTMVTLQVDDLSDLNILKNIEKMFNNGFGE